MILASFPRTSLGFLLFLKCLHIHFRAIFPREDDAILTLSNQVRVGGVHVRARISVGHSLSASSIVACTVLRRSSLLVELSYHFLVDALISCLGHRHFKNWRSSVQIASALQV